MAGRPGTTTTTMTIAMSVLVLLAVLITGGVTQEETVSSIVSTSSSSSSSSPPRPATTPAPTEDYESIDVNVSSSSAAAASEARGGGAPAAGLHRRPGSSDVGCRGLRSKRYISDGFCRTLKPISEVLCTGYCVPERNMPWYPEFMQIWGRAKVMEYRCVDGVVRNQKIRLMCDNGKMRVYNVRVVKSCSCRKHVRPPSSSLQPLNRSHQLPSSATNASALAVADADTTPSRKHNKQRHHGKKRPEPKKNA